MMRITGMAHAVILAVAGRFTAAGDATCGRRPRL